MLCCIVVWHIVVLCRAHAVTTNAIFACGRDGTNSHNSHSHVFLYGTVRCVSGGGKVWDRAQQIGSSSGSWRRQSTSRQSRRSRPGLPSPRPTWVTKIHQAAVLAHRFHFSIAAGRGTNTLRTQRAIIFSAEGKTAVWS